MSVDAHRAAGARLSRLPLALVTVSDTRDSSSDPNGAWLREAAVAIGADVVFQCVVVDDPAQVVRALEDSLSAGARAVVFNGGTGVASRDNTVDALQARYDRPLPGFGELFRLLSWEQVGSSAMLSRACAGIVGRSVLFTVPGSPKAVRLAWDRLIAPEVRHLVAELDR